MIVRANRFHGHNSLRSTYQRAQTVRSGQVSLKYAPNPGRSSYRAAIVVSRKVNKSAVVRNRIRRRMYAIIQNQAAHLKVYDLIFTVFGDQVNQLNPSQLEQLILQQLKKAKVIE